MKDRFKVRAFDRKEKKLYKVLNMSWHNDNIVRVEVLKDDGGILIFDDWCNRINDIILIQCTGLKDNTNWNYLTKTEQKEWLECNTQEEWEGKLIYEGDILKGADEEPNMVVQRCEDCGALTCHQPYCTEFIDTEYGEDEVPCDLAYECSICENNFSMSDQFNNVAVIGNIHENPELLKSEEDV